MLNTLRKIVQEVNSAKDLKAALGIIVLRVKEAMGSQVCSVYLLDPETNRFVLMATEGLNKRSIGKVSMAPNEGLVGLVGTREEPLNLENAADHPRYRYFAETGEERYASFLGAPIIHHRRVVGVLVIQQKERRQFDEGEEAFLVTMSAQLAGVIAHAEATGSIRGLGRQGKGIQVDHAAMNETSLVMALRPELVRMDRLPQDPDSWPVGVGGKDPRKFASPELGNEILKLQTERMANILRQALDKLDK